MEILVTGGEGKLAKELKKKIIGNFPSHKELDITEKSSIKKYFMKKGNPNILIHTAAITNLNLCQKNKQLAYYTNVIGTNNILSYLSKDTYCIYVSTNYIFDGEKGLYSEEDYPSPLNYYGLTKLLGECIVLSMPNFLIVRGTMKERKKWRHPYAPTDMYDSLLFHDEFAEYLVNLAERNAKGVYHVGNGRFSVFEWASRFDPDVKPKTIDEIDFPLPRDCSLDTTKMERFLKTNDNIQYEIRRA